MDESQVSCPLVNIDGVEANGAGVDDHIVRTGDRVFTFGESKDLRPAVSGVFVRSDDFLQRPF
jgi:hypothetical protein